MSTEENKSPLGLKRVLVVDDNCDTASILVEALSVMGYEARCVYEGVTALEMAAAFMPEVALLDIGLPMMSGYQLAQRLRALPGLEKIRLIAVTGFGQERDRAHSFAVGFEAHLLKPIDLEVLFSAIEHGPAGAGPA